MISTQRLRPPCARPDQRQKRQDPAFAAVVGPHDAEDVLEGDDEIERPEDQREHAENVVRWSAECCAGPVKHSLSAYSGLVPMSPYTTPSAASESAASARPRGGVPPGAAPGLTAVRGPGCAARRAPVEQGHDEDQRDDHGRAHAPAADGVDNEQLEVGQIDGEGQADAGEEQQEKRVPASGRSAQRLHAQHQQHQVSDHAVERDLQPQEAAEGAGLDRLTTAGAARQRADSPILYRYR